MRLRPGAGLSPFILVLIGWTFSLSAASSTLIYLRSADAGSLNPAESEDLYSSEVISNIFQGLVRFGRGDQGIQPCLAERWRMEENGKRWIFFLRRGVRFHDGTLVDAGTVVSTLLKRFSRQSPGLRKWWYFYPYLDRIEAAGRFSVHIILKKPYAPLLKTLADPIAFIEHPSASSEIPYRPVGTGPFMFEKWDREDRIILRKFPLYWENEPDLDRLIFKVIKNPTAKIAQMKNGSADVARIDSATELEEFIGARDLTIMTMQTAQTHYLAFNTRKPPFDQLTVRRAFAHLINKEGLIKHIFQRSAVPAHSPIPPQVFGFNPEIRSYEYDPEKSRRLLREAGVIPLSARLFLRDKHVGIHKIASILAVNAKRVGVNMEKVVLPFKELIRRIDRGDHDLVIMGWSGIPDPDAFLFPTLTMSRGNKNRAFYSNPRVERLILRAQQTLDAGERRRLYGDVQRIIHREVPWVALFHQKTMIVYRRDVSGCFVNPLDHLIFRNAVISRRREKDS